MLTKEEILGRIAEVEDPEISLGVVDLGLIYDIAIESNQHVRIKMTLTFPGCPYGPSLISDIRKAAQSIKGVGRVDIDVVWDPPWDPSEMASDYAKDVLGIW
jgi:metal-sulfur cluster biosynthetic enzyme